MLFKTPTGILHCSLRDTVLLLSSICPLPNVPGEATCDGSKDLGPCHPHEKSGQRSWLLVSSWPSPGYCRHGKETSRSKRACSLLILPLSSSSSSSLSLPFSLSWNKQMVFSKIDNLHENLDRFLFVSLVCWWVLLFFLFFVFVLRKRNACLKPTMTFKLRGGRAVAGRKRRSERYALECRVKRSRINKTHG